MEEAKSDEPKPMDEVASPSVEISTPASGAPVETAETGDALCGPDAASTAATASAAAAAPSQKPIAELSETEKKELTQKVLRQVEYYFGDSNFPRDKFMRLEASKDPEGYISISIIASFNRMKSLTTDIGFITDCLKSSDQLTVNEAGTMVKRKLPLPENDTSIPRSIYAKPIPQDATIDDISQYFSAHAKVLSVQLRRSLQTRAFKGSIFVEFETPEEAQKVASSKLQYAGVDLTLKTRVEYIDQKAKEHAERQAKKRSRDGKPAGQPQREQQQREHQPEAPRVVVPGHILKFEFENAESIQREHIQVHFANYGAIGYIEYERGGKLGFIRFQDPVAQAAIDGFQADKRDIAGQTPTLTLLQGEAEQEYWRKAWEAMDRKRDFAQGRWGGRGGGRSRGRGGRGGGRDRGRGGGGDGRGKRRKMQGGDGGGSD